MNTDDLKAAIYLLTHSVDRLRHAIEAQQGQDCCKLATKQDLADSVRTIMANVSEAIKKYSDDVKAEYDKLGTHVDGISKDVANIKAKLDQLNNNPGPISDADQKLLDDSLAVLKGLNEKVQALDDATEDAPTPDGGTGGNA